MVPDASPIAVRRAVNDIQARTKKWWSRHPEQPRDFAVVDYSPYQPEGICCGIVREVNSKFTCVGILTCEGATVRSRKWSLLEENPIQIDTSSGTEWVIKYADWELPADYYTRKIQAAIIATSGMQDEDLAKLLKVSSSDIKKWYTGKTIMPNKVIKEIVKRFIYGN